MIPQKKDLAMSMTTNIYMNTTTKYVPVPITSTQKPSPEKLKQESFVYRPPAPKNKNPVQSQNASEIKPSINSNPRPSGIQVSKVSDLGSSSLFKGLDGLYEKPVQQCDRSKSEKAEQKPVQVASGPSQNRFERNQRNKLNDDSVSSTQYKGVSPRNQPTKSQAKQQVHQTNNTQILVRKPLGRAPKQEQKEKQVEKSPMITRKNQVETKTSSAQQESFTTQTLSYVYKPVIKRTSAANETSQINSAQTKTTSLGSQKKQQVKPQPKVSVPSVQQNIYARNRSRESKEVELSLEINTEVSYFKIQTKGSTLRRSSKEGSNTGRQSVEVKDNPVVSNEKPEKAPISQGKSIYAAQKTTITPIIESPKNIDSETKIQKEVPYYMKPKPKPQVSKQTTLQQQNEQKIKSPPKTTIAKSELQQPAESKGYVYKPRTYQNPVTKATTNQADSSVQSKTQVETKPLNTQNQSKPVPYQLRKQKQQEPKESVKTVTETQPYAPKYPINRKPVPAQLQTENVKQQIAPTVSSPKNLQTIKTTQKPQENPTNSSNQNTKTNTSGYVYQPPNRKMSTPNVELKTANEDAKSSNKISVTTNPLPPVNQRQQIARNNESSKDTHIKQIQSPKNTKNQGLKETPNQIGNQQTKISPIYPRKQQETQTKKQQSSYPYKRNSLQSQQLKTQPQKTKANQPSQTKPTVYRPAYLQNKKQPQVTSKPISNNAIKDTKQQESKTEKKPIPNSAFSIFGILIRKKLKSNLKFSFKQISQSSKSSINRDKLINSLALKSLTFSSNYETYLKTQAFFVLKKAFLFSLVSPTSSNQIGQSSRILATQSNKTKETKEESQLSTLTNNNRKILCLKLHSIFNSKIREVFKEKMLKPFDQNNYTAKKSPIFQALLKIFSIKTSSHLSNAFSKLKFNFSYVSKLNDTDLLPLFETKNKKLSKQQIAKYLQNIYQTIPSSNTASRSSLLQKTPDKGFLQKKQLGKSPSIKSIGSSAQKSQSQKVISLRTRIQNLEKEKNQQEKLTKDKESEIVSKKLELKRQMNSLKKESEQRKKENQQLKQKLKKYEVFNNFGDTKDIPILRADNDIFGKEQGFASNQNIATSESNEFLNILCNFYIQNALKGNSLNSLEIETFLRTHSDLHPSVGESLNYLLNPENQSGFPTLKSDELMKGRLDRTRDLISERILIEQNLLLKKLISSIESQFTEEDPVSSTHESPKVQEQVDTMKNLVKNYIKERYLWEWIRNSISKI